MTRNPVLAIRYKSLIYDFALEVTGHKPNCRDLSKSICESIIATVEGGYLSIELREFKLMDRAVQLGSRTRLEWRSLIRYEFTGVCCQKPSVSVIFD